MGELYSRPLSSEARLKLIDFLQAYLGTLAVSEVDEKAEIAKAKAIEALKTDIDILTFVTVFMVLPQAAPFIQDFIEGRRTPQEVAKLIVAITEEAQKMDKSTRPGGNPN